jgi:hypothetical protein
MIDLAAWWPCELGVFCHCLVPWHGPRATHCAATGFTVASVRALLEDPGCPAEAAGVGLGCHSGAGP